MPCGKAVKLYSPAISYILPARGHLAPSELKGSSSKLKKGKGAEHGVAEGGYEM